MTSELCTLVQEREREMVKCAETTRDRKLAAIMAIKQADSKITSEAALVSFLCLAALSISTPHHLVSICTLNSRQ